VVSVALILGALRLSSHHLPANGNLLVAPLQPPAATAGEPFAI
jgi:hypothetical protein